MARGARPCAGNTSDEPGGGYPTRRMPGLAALANYYYTCTLYAVRSIRLPGNQLFPKTCGVIVISSIPEDTKAKDLSVCDLMH